MNLDRGVTIELATDKPIVGSNRIVHETSSLFGFEVILYVSGHVFV
jgi:hypothetical protein